MKSLPIKVSIVIVNFNGISYLESCIDSILKSKYKNFEIVVVDNGSTDGTKDLFAKKYSNYSQISCLFLDQNYGPSMARNIGVANSNGQYLCFVDNDTIIDKFCLSEGVKTLSSSKYIGACQCKLLLMDDPQKIDYAGDYLTKVGFLKQIFTAGDLAKNVPNKNYEIFAAKSAGMMVKRSAFYLAGGYDNDYFIYMEETDLCWRIWLAGYKIVFSPKSIILHKFGTTNRLFPGFQTYLARFHGPKNYLQTLIKNLSAVELIKILPINIIIWLGVALQQIISFKFMSGIYILLGLLWIPLNIVKVIKKRVLVQKNRKINDLRLFKHVMRSGSFGYFFSKYFSKSTVSGLKAINEK